MLAERRPSASPARPAAAVSAVALRRQLSERLQTPFIASVLPTRTRRRGAATSSTAAAPSHRPDRLAERSAAALKPGRPRRVRGRCRRRRRVQAGGRAGPPASAAAHPASREGEGNVERRKPRALVYSRHMQDMNIRAREPARNDVRSTRDRVISPSGGISWSDSSSECAAIDTAVPAAPDSIHSAACAAKAPAVSDNNGRVETHAVANNTLAESRRRTSVTAAAGLLSCQSRVDSAEVGGGTAVGERGPEVRPANGGGSHPSLVCSGTQTESEGGSERRRQPCPVCRRGQDWASV